MKSVAKGGLNDWVKYEQVPGPVLLPQRVAQTVAMDQPRKPARELGARARPDAKVLLSTFSRPACSNPDKIPWATDGSSSARPHRSANPQQRHW